MKKILLLLLSALLLISCEKNYLVPASEVPEWFEDRIAETEKEIRTNEMSALDMCAWVRYTY